MLTADIIRHRREIARALENHRYDVTDTGIVIPSMRIAIGGVFESWLNHRDHQVDANLIPTEGLNHVLSVVCKGGAQVTTWRTALFEGNVTPTASYTAANFHSNATEFTGYDEANRVEWNEGTVSAGSVSNSANKADFTIASGVTNKTLYGAALLSVATKQSTSGTLLAVSAFSTPRVVNATDVLSVQYTLTMTSS